VNPVKFNEIFSGFVESGIYARWGYFRSIYERKTTLRRLREDLIVTNNVNVKIHKRTKYLAFVQNQKNSLKFTNPAAPLDFNFFDSIGLLFLFCISLSVMNFAFETFIRLKKWIPVFKNWVFSTKVNRFSKYKPAG